MTDLTGGIHEFLKAPKIVVCFMSNFYQYSELWYGSNRIISVDRKSSLKKKQRFHWEAVL